MQILMEHLELLERLEIARQSYRRATGKFPTRLVLTEDDLAELNCWIADNPTSRKHVGALYTTTPEVLGMVYRVDTLARHSSLHFQES